MDEHRMFDQQIHDAFERVTLSDEAQERMLGTLLVAQAARREEPAPAPTVPPATAPAPVAFREVPATPAARAPRVRRHLPAWLPLAAVAACVFVVVGVVGVVGGVSKQAETSPAVAFEEAASEDAGAAEDKATLDLSEDEAEPDAFVTNDTAAGAAGESLAAMPDEVAEEAVQLQLVDLYPRITLDDGSTYTALVDGMYTTEVEPEAVGARVGAGQASPFDADDAVPCEVFELTDDADAFVVRYEGEETYWYCTRL